MKISKILKLLIIKCYSEEDFKLFKNNNMIMLRDTFFRENISDKVTETFQ